MIDLKCVPAVSRLNDNTSRPAKTRCRQPFPGYLKLIITAFIFALISQPASAAEVALEWDSSDGATGYKVYYGIESHEYPFVVDIGPWTECTIAGLDQDRVYYFAVTAYDDLDESGFSSEIEHIPDPCAADFDVDGDTDGSDLYEMIIDPSAYSINGFAVRFGLQECDG